MSRKRKRDRTPTPLAASQDSRGLAVWWRPACLSFATALLVATPLVPSERTELTGAALPFVMLWLLLALIWFAGAALLGVRLGKFGWIDAAMLAMVTWQVVSGLIMMHHGAARPTINAMWTWVSFAVIVIMLRQLLRDQREARSLCAVMIGLAVCLSVMALFQATITYPSQRAYYEAAPDRALQEAGVHAPEGSAARKQFESRLYSSEPTATFSLTNSLAGYLAPWFVLLLGIATLRFFTRSSNTQFATKFALPITLIAICLLLTKSRTATLAVIIGSATLIAIILYGRGHRRKLWIAAAIAPFVIILPPIILPNTNLANAAALSLKYRFEYWQSTLAMIADYPLFGCGVGNFQEYYTTYKLPQASESIADPHNFLMEISATAGIPALMLLLILLALTGWALKGSGVFFSDTGSDSLAGNKEKKTPDPVSPYVSNVPFYFGGIAGIFLAIPLGIITGYPPPVESLLLGAIIAGFCVGLLRNWISHGQLPRWLAALVIGVLLINLLAAGGISFPGVAMTLWVLIAVITFDAPGRAWRPSPIAALVLLTPLAVGLLMTCYSTGYKPVLRRQSLMASASEALATAKSSGRLGPRYEYPQAIAFAGQAADADPWSVQPHLLIPMVLVADWSDGLSPYGDYDFNDYDGYEQHTETALQLGAHSYQAASAIGYLDLLIGRRARNGQPYARDAIKHFQRAVALYPNDAMTHAQLAMAYHFLDDDSRAAASATEALRLDALCPHEERKLANRRLFAEIGVAQANDRLLRDTSDHSAEQWMHEILDH